LYGSDEVDEHDRKAYETPITKRVTSVEVYPYGNDLNGFRFGHPDGTITATPRINGKAPSSSVVHSYTI